MRSTLRLFIPTSGTVALATWTLAALAAACVVGLFVDTRLVLGANPWMKPLRFCVSLVIFLMTMHGVFRLVPVRGARAYAGLFAAVAVIEVLLISLQSVRGVPSHHNFSTPFNAAVYQTMGVVIAINTLAVAVLIVQMIWEKLQASAVLRLSIMLGLVMFVLGSMVGVVMSVRGAHAVGVPDGGAGLPLAGWSTSGGDLRAAHFLGLHGLQVMLGAGLLLDRWAHKPRRVTPALVATCVLFLLWLALTAGAFVQALRGRPIIEASPRSHIEAPGAAAHGALALVAPRPSSEAIGLPHTPTHGQLFPKLASTAVISVKLTSPLRSASPGPVAAGA